MMRWIALRWHRAWLRYWSTLQRRQKHVCGEADDFVVERVRHHWNGLYPRPTAIK